MSYLPSASVTQWTISNIVSTRTIQCGVGMMRESFVEAWTPHCRSSQMRTSTTCFSGLSQTVTTSITMCGLMLTLSVSITLIRCIGLTDNRRASNHTICRVNSKLISYSHVSNTWIMAPRFPLPLFSDRRASENFSSQSYVLTVDYINSGHIKFCLSTNKLNNVFTGQCLLLCVALKISNSYWSASIGLKHNGSVNYANINATHWTTELSYVCQYHSKSLHGLSLSVYQSVASQWWCC